jgi:hypothetical protein
MVTPITMTIRTTMTTTMITITTTIMITPMKDIIATTTCAPPWFT